MRCPPHHAEGYETTIPTAPLPPLSDSDLAFEGPRSLDNPSNLPCWRVTYRHVLFRICRDGVGSSEQLGYEVKCTMLKREQHVSHQMVSHLAGRDERPTTAIAFCCRVVTSESGRRNNQCSCDGHGQQQMTLLTAVAASVLLRMCSFALKARRVISIA